MEVSGQFYSLTALPIGKVPLGGLQSLSGQIWRKERSHTPAGNGTTIHQSSSP